jgi:hypothetical protein
VVVNIDISKIVNEDPKGPKASIEPKEPVGGEVESEPEDAVMVEVVDLTDKSNNDVKTDSKNSSVAIEVTRESERKEPKVPDAKKDAPPTTIVVAPPVKNDVGTSTNPQKAELNEALVKLLSILPTLLKDIGTTSLPQGTGN